MQANPSKPLKRHPALQPLSHDHHHGLLLCWKIRTGFNRGVASDRMKRYIDWFWHNHLESHFEIEERDIFPILGNKNKLVKRALAEHRRLKRLFTEEVDIERSLSLIEEELENHIRFEERILFNEIQRIASPAAYAAIQTLHHDKTVCENWPDEFWKKQPCR